jgi:hypothetical protein
MNVLFHIIEKITYFGMAFNYFFVLSSNTCIRKYRLLILITSHSQHQILSIFTNLCKGGSCPWFTILTLNKKY